MNFEISITGQQVQQEWLTSTVCFIISYPYLLICCIYLYSVFHNFVSPLIFLDVSHPSYLIFFFFLSQPFWIFDRDFTSCLRNDFFFFFFQVTSTFSIFFLDFYFPFLFGFIFTFSVWTFISLFYLDFYFPFLFGL